MAESIRDEIDRLVPPDPQFPRLSRVGSKIGNEEVHWILHRTHPLSPGFTIMRMYRRLTGIKVYSMGDNGQMGLLNFIPRERVTLSEEIMSPQVLIQEIVACEAGEDDKEDLDPVDDPDDDDPDVDDDENADRPTAPPTAPTTSNGPAVS